MTVSGNKREHLSRAKAFLATEQSADLRYAALELRLCLEAMTYDKLRSFAKYLPPSFLERTWQPPQLLKAMKQLDSGADQSVRLLVGAEAVYGVPPKDEEFKLVGEHKAFGQAWLRKHYNKLGSLLHLQPNDAAGDETEHRTYLSTLAGEIEDAQRGSILGLWFGETSNFICQLCNEQVTVSVHFARTEGRAICLNPSCEAEYKAEIQGNEASFLLRASEFPCTSCSEPVIVQLRHLKPGLVVTCSACKRNHVIRCTWQYGAVDEPAPPGASTNE